MHKKIESELVSLAHSILQMKNREDILALKEKAHAIYEKLSVLAFVDRYLEATPSASREEIEKKMEAMDAIIVEEVISDMTTEKPLPEKKVSKVKKEKKQKKAKKEKLKSVKKTDNLTEDFIAATNKQNETPKKKKAEEKKEVNEVEPIEDLFSVSSTASVKNSLEEELGDTIPLDVATNMFEKAVRVETTKKSLNDTLIHKNLQIGLNDRIAFVKHLFEGSQEDFNRVVSQLNSLKTEKEAVDFVSKMVKLDYDWNGKEEYEERFISLISRKFA